MAQSSMRGRSRQRAKTERVHVRDCRAEGEGQLGREGQGTESCGMPDGAAASAGWSHGYTVHGPVWESAVLPLGTRRRHMQLDGEYLSHSGLQRGPGSPLVTVGEGRSAVKSHSELKLRGRGEGEELAGFICW